jgi:serine O-acetyltransferase
MTNEFTINPEFEVEIFLTIFLYRISHILWRWRVPILPRVLYYINRILFSVVLPPSVVIGQDFHLAYSGLATVIHARCRIGNRVCISQCVTIGGRSGLFEVPVIEDDVEIGAGAKILGPIVVGRGAKIGANAVVIQDVPPGATFVGIPASNVRPVNT